MSAKEASELLALCYCIYGHRSLHPFWRTSASAGLLQGHRLPLFRVLQHSLIPLNGRMWSAVDTEV